MAGTYRLRKIDAAQTRWIMGLMGVLLVVLAWFLWWMAHRGQTAYAASVLCYVLVYMWLYYRIFFSTLATFTWDSDGVAQTQRSKSWQLRWADLAEVTAVVERRDQTRFRLTLTDGTEQFVSVIGRRPEAEALRAELRSRTTARPAARPMVVPLGSSLVIEPAKDDLKRAAMVPWLSLVATVAGAVMFALGVHTPWRLAILGSVDNRTQGNLVMQGAMLLVFFPWLPLALRGVGWRSVLEPDGLRQTRGGRERFLPWHAVERVLWHGMNQRAGSGGHVSLVGGGQRLTVRAGSDQMVAALSLILDRCRNARLENRTLQAERSDQDDRLAALLALPVRRSRLPVITTMLLAILLLPVSMLALVSSTEGVNAANASHYLRQTQATVDRPCSLESSSPHVHYSYKVGGHTYWGMKATPNGTWRSYPRGARFAVVYNAADPDSNWPADGPAKPAKPFQPFGEARTLGAVAAGLAVLFVLALAWLRVAPVPSRSLASPAELR